jgi:hypothetical protein
VPDVRRAAERFLANDRDFFRAQPADTIADSFILWLAMRGEPVGGRLERAARRLLRTDEAGHQWMYDGESMILRMRRAGFREVVVQRYRVSHSSAAAELDSRELDSVHIDALR